MIKNYFINLVIKRYLNFKILIKEDNLEDDYEDASDELKFEFDVISNKSKNVWTGLIKKLKNSYYEKNFNLTLFMLVIIFALILIQYNIQKKVLKYMIN
jgi:hypothetical protein